VILDDILAHKRAELLAARRAVPFEQVKAAAEAQPPARPFGAALRPPGSEAGPRLIAEIKKVSPAKGVLAAALDVPAMARLYAANGAAAISVLTDERFFGGSLDDLRAARAAVVLPVLRKDFIFSAYQLYEARAAGADAALLIVGALASPLADPARLEQPVEAGAPDYEAAHERLAALLEAAREAGIECLVEVHDEAELEVATRAGAPVIGINNRDLRTFAVHLDTTERLAPRVPAGAVLVSESGIETRADVRRLRAAGASAILVGSAIVAAPDPAAKVRELAGG
jgi:indole-3-glycerol phosphate synthase